MAKGDNSIPMADLYAAAGDAKNAVKAARQELAELTREMRAAEKQGKQLDAAKQRRLVELSKIQEQQGRILQNEARIKKTIGNVKSLNSALGQRAATALLTGHVSAGDVADLARFFSKGDGKKLLERAIGSAAPTVQNGIRSALRIAPVATFVGEVTQAYFDDLQNSEEARGKASKSRAKFSDQVRDSFADPTLARKIFDGEAGRHVTRNTIGKLIEGAGTGLKYATFGIDFGAGGRRLEAWGEQMQADAEQQASEGAAKRLKAVTTAALSPEQILGLKPGTLNDIAARKVGGAQNISEMMKLEIAQAIAADLKPEDLEARVSQYEARKKDEERQKILKELNKTNTEKWMDQNKEVMLQVQERRWRDRVPAFRDD